MMMIVPTLYEPRLSDVLFPLTTVSYEQAEHLFTFFQQHPLFNWRDSHNGCEGRADAICVLLDEWHIPNYKAWVFGGAYLRKNHIGGLKHNWNYHVAPVLAVEKDGTILQYVLDPSTGNALQLIDEWAAGVTQLPHSYYCIRQPHWYIFPVRKISTSVWHTRNKQNRKWMIQSLAGINGLSATGKAKIVFAKTRVRKLALAFQQLKRQRPL